MNDIIHIVITYFIILINALCYQMQAGNELKFFSGCFVPTYQGT